MTKKMMAKRIAISYGVMIIVFGFIYWLIAMGSDGKSFSFNEDILRTNKIEAFKDKVGLKI